MYIGKLNDKLTYLKFSVKKTDTDIVPEATVGNPFKGEKLTCPWHQLVMSGLDFSFEFSGDYFINSIVIFLGNNCAPESIRLYTGDKLRVLDKYQAETGKTITEKKIILSLDEKINSFTLTLDSAFNDVEIENIDIYGGEFSGISIFPTPKYVKDTGKKIPASTFSTSDCNNWVLFEKFIEKTGCDLRHVNKNAQISVSYVESLNANSYILDIKEDHVSLKYYDPRGLVMGIETFIKLIDKDGFLPVCTIEDEPFCKFRGIHLYLPSEEDVEFYKRLVKYMLSPLGYNYIIMEICGAMEFKTHPEINEKYVEANEKYKQGIWPKLPHGSVGGGKIVSQATIRRFCKYTREFGIEIIPEIQSLGHVQFMTLAHPEIAEIPADKKEEEITDERLADIPPDEFYAHSFCPSNEKSYEILFDLMDEIIGTFDPREYVHMGHDEIYQIGVCPICSKKDPADIYVKDVTRLHNFLRERGLKMMLWADMLQPVSAYKTVSAIDRIPKDIILLDFIWYFHMDKNIEQNLVEKGFRVAIGNLYSSHFPRFEERIRNNLWGGQISAWVQTNEKILQKEGKLYDFIYTAQMLWSESYTERARFSYDRMIRALIPDMRNKIQDVTFNEKETVLHKGTASSLNLSVNKKCESIIFTHAMNYLIARVPWSDPEEIGFYEIKYTDGTVENIPIINGGNIYYIGRRQNLPLQNGYYRHNGYVGVWTSDEIHDPISGTTFYRYQWKNPHPEKEVESISLKDETTMILINEVGITE